MTLATWAAGSGVTLAWTPWCDASSYWIYGAQNEPWFTPGLTDPYAFRLAVLPCASTTWITPEGARDPACNMTVTVIAMDYADRQMVRSHRAGEFDFDMAHPSSR